MQAWKLYTRKVAINQEKDYQCSKYNDMLTRENIAHPSTPLQKICEPVPLIVPGFKM